MRLPMNRTFHRAGSYPPLFKRLPCAREHPSLTSPQGAIPGNGLLLFFRVDNFDMALSKARTLVGQLEQEPQVNPHTGTMEFSLRDLDGYYVMISALSA
jgi:hypothetical protein